MGNDVSGPVAGVVQLRVQIHPDNVGDTKVHKGLTKGVHVGYERVECVVELLSVYGFDPLDLF